MSELTGVNLEEVASLCITAAVEAAKAGRDTEQAAANNNPEEYDIVVTRERITKAMYALQSAMAATGRTPFEQQDTSRIDRSSECAWYFRWYDRDAVISTIPLVHANAEKMTESLRSEFANPMSFVAAWTESLKCITRMANTFDVVNDKGESFFDDNQPNRSSNGGTD